MKVNIFKNFDSTDNLNFFWLKHISFWNNFLKVLFSENVFIFIFHYQEYLCIKYLIFVLWIYGKNLKDDILVY